MRLPRQLRYSFRLNRSIGFCDVLSLLFFLLLASMIGSTNGFGIGVLDRSGITIKSCQAAKDTQQTIGLFMSSGEGVLEEDFEEEIGDDADTGSVVLEDLNWRVAKQRLEEQNTKRFLKARPRFLPYEECRRWVQAWGQRWQSEEEWREWIYMGEKRNPYIPVSVCVSITERRSVSWRVFPQHAFRVERFGTISNTSRFPNQTE